MKHPPLTQQQIDILDQIPAEGIELTVAEQQERGWSDLGYLGQCGYLLTEQTGTDPSMNKWTYKWTRTEKAVA